MTEPPRQEGSDQARMFSEQTLSLVRRMLLVCLVLGGVSVLVVLILRGPQDRVIRYGFPVLLVAITVFAWVVVRRPRVVIVFSRSLLTVLVVSWLALMDYRLQLPPAQGGGWNALFPTVFMGLALFVVIGYLVYPTRVALLHAVVITGAALTVGTVGLRLGPPEGSGHLVDLVRYGVYLLVLTGMVYVLSRTKEHAALAFRVAEHAEAEARTLRELAHRDALTGLANRRRLVDELGFQSALVNAGQDVSVVYLDLDRFKTVNDEQGHTVGDEVLRAVAAAALREVGPADLVARLGGEEFVVVAPGMSLSRAAVLAEQLRHAIPVATEIAVGTAVTASFGVAAMQPGEEPHELLARVDALMYSAKRAGRDAVVAAVE
ncbi:GGDEF domain-containing protein [Cellulomonas hominis]